MPIIRADARRLPIRDGCVNCVVTSPPYFNLRDYGDSRQIGSGQTPGEFIASLVDVFGEVRRVLKSDGTVWLNLGDSYAAGGKGGGGSFMAERRDAAWQKQSSVNGWRRQPEGCKEKDLLGIPWAVAFALRDDGWYLRSDIIWAKPNPMPESVTDRPTKSHEYLFLLTKSERYWYDAAAIAEPVSASMLAEVEQGYEGLGLKDYASAGVQNPSSVKTRIIANARRKQDAVGKATYTGFNDRYDFANPAPTRNRRSVWTIPTMPYSGAHFATMPEALVQPCILAGCPLGGLVLDPFLGSGTVGVVAERLGRRWVGTDLSYQTLSKKRTRQQGLRFA